MSKVVNNNEIRKKMIKNFCFSRYYLCFSLFYVPYNASERGFDEFKRCAWLYELSINFHEICRRPTDHREVINVDSMKLNAALGYTNYP